MTTKELRIGQIYVFEYNSGEEQCLVKIIDFNDQEVEVENIDGDFFQAENPLDTSLFVDETGTLFAEKINFRAGKIFIPLNVFLESFDFFSGSDIDAPKELNSSKINFNRYHKENPEIYKQFKNFTFEAIEKGFKNYSANGIFEAIRWQTKTSGNDTFKVNNIYRPDYARLFEKDFPEYEGFFRKRKLHAKRTKGI
jgi:hypothetical protein